MALLTDADHISAADMAAVDPELNDVATQEGITIEGDASICRNAWDECADFVLGKMDSFGGTLTVFGSPLAAGAGLLDPLRTLGTTASRVTLSQIVVSDPYPRRLSPMRRWMLYHALALFYRAASNRSISDRYAQKLERFELDAERHWKVLMVRGLPVVLKPVPAPGAIHEPNTGDWSPDNNLFAVANPTSTWPAGPIDIAITWLTGGVSAAESGPSQTLTLSLNAAQSPVVYISTLLPPSGAIGWNIYAAKSGASTLWLQNAQPLALSQSAYPLAAAPVLAGTPLSTGQAPDFAFAFQNTLQRM
jgi:hypothetical protein